MDGARLDALKQAMTGLAGLDTVSPGTSRSSAPREDVTFITFSTRRRRRRRTSRSTRPIRTRPRSSQLRDYVERPAGRRRTPRSTPRSTRAYAGRATAQPGRPERLTSIVLMTDGENNAGMIARPIPRTILHVAAARAARRADVPGAVRRGRPDGAARRSPTRPAARCSTAARRRCRRCSRRSVATSEPGAGRSVRDARRRTSPGVARGRRPGARVHRRAGAAGRARRSRPRCTRSARWRRPQRRRVERRRRDSTASEVRDEPRRDRARSARAASRPRSRQQVERIATTIPRPCRARTRSGAGSTGAVRAGADRDRLPPDRPARLPRPARATTPTSKSLVDGKTARALLSRAARRAGRADGRGRRRGQPRRRRQAARERPLPRREVRAGTTRYLVRPDPAADPPGSRHRTDRAADDERRSARRRARRAAGCGGTGARARPHEVDDEAAQFVARVSAPTSRRRRRTLGGRRSAARRRRSTRRRPRPGVADASDAARSARLLGDGDRRRGGARTPAALVDLASAAATMADPSIDG